MQKIALNERSKQLIKNYILGGAALGGSAALTTSLLNYLKMLKDESNANKSESDDDTLYVNLPEKTAADEEGGFSPANMAAGGLAMTGGVLSTLGTYALIRKLYQNMKRKQLQEQLDEAQQTFLGAAEEEAKQAALQGENKGYKPMGVGEFLTSAPVAFALLSAIAGGALTNMALNKTFPAVKTPTELGPKKIVLRRKKKEEDEEEPMPEQEKMGSEDDAMELLLGLAMHNKSAANSELVDIVHAVAQGRRDEFTSNMLEYGFDAAMDSIKGASLKPMDSITKQLAIGSCIKSAALNPVVTLLAAAEYNDMAPKFTKIASLLGDHNKAVLVKIASILGAMHRESVLSNFENSIDISKSANEENLDISAILDLVNQMRQGQDQGEIEDMESNDDITGEDSISSNEEKEVNDLHPTKTKKDSPEIIDELGADDDLIDQAMSQPIDAAKAVAVESK